MSDQTDAATITPDAKPSRIFCSMAGISLCIKNTNAEPSAVPRNGINNPISIAFISPFICKAPLLSAREKTYITPINRYPLSSHHNPVILIIRFATSSG